VKERSAEAGGQARGSEGVISMRAFRDDYRENSRHPPGRRQGGGIADCGIRNVDSDRRQESGCELRTVHRLRPRMG